MVAVLKYVTLVVLSVSVVILVSDGAGRLTSSTAFKDNFGLTELTPSAPVNQNLETLPETWWPHNARGILAYDSIFQKVFGGPINLILLSNACRTTVQIRNRKQNSDKIFSRYFLGIQPPWMALQNRV